MTLLPAPQVLHFDHLGRASLDGMWEFFPGDHELATLEGLAPESILVPGLWEAQGHLELDGVAWYRRRIPIPAGDDERERFWTLRFGAVMDVAEVYWNGALLGVHDSPFTPFELDPTPHVVPGDNVLAVRVFDPPLDHPDHIRSAHGKQGWANHVFPSRPSLYMTYGGIWQPVTLRSHDAAVIEDVFVNSDPDALAVDVVVANRSAEPVTVRLGVRTVGLGAERIVELGGAAGETVRVELGATPAARWHPDAPVLHDLVVTCTLDGRIVDGRQLRYGLRTLRIDGTRLLINGEPYRMKSALVQGFRAEELYAEGSRQAVIDEVRAAQAMGFNTLRLHIKAFDPAYLYVCDQLGMLVHCDLPVAEPIAHEEMGDGNTLTSRRCLTAIAEQVRRDRNHPSIILWSAMNELTLDRIEARDWPNYEVFARALYGAVSRLDPTRPVIENDWVEPDPERVYASPILTAHWYGRLHADYLDKIETASAACADYGRPLYVTEFGDWGLPEMPATPEPAFWDPREVYTAGLTVSRWPAGMGRFVAETQRYQGVSDRLQAEVFRRHDHLGGYCVTELTDVPHELNGLLDLHRQPKPLAVAEITRANQTVLPMLAPPSLVVNTGALLRAPLHVANDGPELVDVEVEVRFSNSVGAMGLDELLATDATGLTAAEVVARFGESVSAVRADRLPAYRASCLGTIEVAVPDVPGGHDLRVTLTAGGVALAENSYPIHVVTRPRPIGPVRVVGGGVTAAALEALGAAIGDDGPTVVAEAALTAGLTGTLRDRLAAGESVVVLAQPPEHASHYPVDVTIDAVETAWGSSVFHFTTDEGVLPSFPRRNVLVAEESTIQARSVLTRIQGDTFPTRPVVIAYKPVPGSMTGTVVGGHVVGTGELIFCQYRLCERAVAGDAAARSLLADVVAWAIDPPARMVRRPVTKADGRSLTYYSWPRKG